MLEFIIKYWIQILFTLILSLFTHFFREISKYKKKLDATNEGIIVLLKVKIIEQYNNFTKKDTISIEEKEGIIDLYNVYKKFECCDVIKDLMEKINSIQIK